MEISHKTLQLVRASAPALQAKGDALVKHFYKHMLTNNPPLRNIFNAANQITGAQPKALLATIRNYATKLDDLPSLGTGLERIAHKHCALGVKPEQYSIVGGQLLDSIREVLEAPPEMLQAWGEAYGQLADALIKRENELYKQQQEAPGGWRGTREFTVAKCEDVCDIVTSFTMVPKDAQPVVRQEAGQFTSCYMDVTGLTNDPVVTQAIRHYTISSLPDGMSYRTSIKKEDTGLVSKLFHEKIQEGDTIKLAPPFGTFVVPKCVSTTTPVAFLSAGIGVTPCLAMGGDLVHSKHHTGMLRWIHVCHEPRFLVHGNEVVKMSQTHPDFKSKIWVRSQWDGKQLEGFDETRDGMKFDWEHVEPEMLAEGHFFMCGPPLFSRDVTAKLLSLGVPNERIHYELFGPHQDVSEAKQ